MSVRPDLNAASVVPSAAILCSDRQIRISIVSKRGYASVQLELVRFYFARPCFYSDVPSRGHVPIQMFLCALKNAVKLKHSWFSSVRRELLMQHLCAAVTVPCFS